MRSLPISGGYEVNLLNVRGRVPYMAGIFKNPKMQVACDATCNSNPFTSMKPKGLARNPFANPVSLTLALVATLGSSASQAAPITWNGNTNGDWGLNTNWSTFTVPTAADDVTILGPLNVAGPLNIDIATPSASNTIIFTDTSPVSLSNTLSGVDQTLAITAGITTGTGAVAIGSATANQGINLSLAAANAWNVGSGGLTIHNSISGTAFGISKSGAGTLTLAGANSYTGPTGLSAGTLVLANAAALGGTSTLTFSGTGATLDIATNGGDTAFATNAGAGTVATILSNRANSGAGINHTLGTGAYSAVTVNVQKGGNVASGTASLTYGAVALTSGTAGAVTTFNPTSANLFIGTVSTTTNNVAHTLGLDGTSTGNEVTGIISNGLTAAVSITKSNTGTWKLSGANSATGAVTVAGGQLNISGSLGINGTNANFRVGTVNNTKAILNILPGAVINNRFNLFIGDSGAGTGGGAVYQSGGSLILTQGASVDNLRIGSNSGGYGYYNMSGGSLTTNEIGVAASLAGTVGILDVSAGTVANNGWTAVGRGGTTSSGMINLTGGTMSSLRVDMNWGGTAGATSVLNVGGGSTAAGFSTTGSTTLGLSLASANVTGTVGMANLLTNGTLTTGIVTAGSTGTGANPTSLLNFNGGTLKATSTNAAGNFLTSANVDAVTVYSGGGTIDNSGTAVTIGKALLAPTGNGVTSIAVANGGSGYVGAPMLTFSGGTGNGASAFAKMVDDGTGNGTFKIDSIVVTSAGTYSVNPTTVNLLGGGANTAATIGAITTAANSSGGMTLTGTSAGTTTLTGASTLSGNLTIKGGTKVIANLGNNFFNPTNSALGNNQVARSIIVSESSTLQFNSGDTLGGNNSTILSKIVIGAGSTVTNGGVVFNRIGSVDLNGGTLTATSGAIAGYQAYSFDANAVVTVGGTTASTISSPGSNGGFHLNTDTGFVVADVTGSVASDLNVSAPLIDRNATETGAGGLTKSGAGTMTLTGVNTYTGVTNLANGTLALGVGGSIANSSTIDVKSGATLDATAQSGWSLATGQTLKGTGTVNVGAANTFTVGGGATLSPGASPGTLAVTGTLSFASLSTFSAEIAPNTPTADLVNVTGNLNVDSAAVLALSLFGTDTVLAEGTKFTLVDYTGAWNNVAFAGFADETTTVLGLNTYLLDYNDASLGGTALTLTVIPEASTFALVSSFGVLSLLRRRRKNG